MGLVSKFFEVHGKVQTQFKKNPENKGKVLCMLKGEENLVEDYINFLEQKKVINSWHATVDKIIQSKEEQSLEDYEVTTQNVDHFKWSSDVDMYV